MFIVLWKLQINFNYLLCHFVKHAFLKCLCARQSHATYDKIILEKTLREIQCQIITFRMGGLVPFLCTGLPFIGIRDDTGEKVTSKDFWSIMNSIGGWPSLLPSNISLMFESGFGPENVLLQSLICIINDQRALTSHQEIRTRIQQFQCNRDNLYFHYHY